ncbi:hypothetical protein FLA_6095 [Filimonas lacunae]|nr:hypothetical protein FLA_6095 [Filimonas lacunae]
MDDYTVDIPATSSAVDTWLNTYFNVPWNINVQYRFALYEAEYAKNVAPIELNKVQPSMQAVLTCFINPYSKIAGASFGKVQFPKQWVLYGSGSYNTDNSYTLGSATNARRVDLYDLNNFSAANGENVRRRMRTVHHEFTHCLNQSIPIPPAFELVSKGDYDPEWTTKTDSATRMLGFVSPYASSAYTEDFAEMVGHIVVEGPVWYNNCLAQAGATGKARLKEKESIIYQYLLNYFNIDLYKLQAEVQSALKTSYGVVDPEDVTLSFPYRIAGNAVNTITINPSATHYTTYGSSAAFTTVYNNYKASLFSLGSRTLDSIQFVFSTATQMAFRAYYRNSANTNLVADYDFTIALNTSTGLVSFSKKMPEGTTTNYSNGANAQVQPAFEQYILPYLVNRQFIAAYLPTTITSGNALYRSFAGFYVNGTATNYFYGPVTYK